MSTLPFALPTCGRPAAVRIEVYSPAGGMAHGSLDGAVYACEQHAAEVVSAIHAAGLTAYRVPMAPDAPGASCGHVYVFPTGQLGDNPHPGWCDQQDCARRGEHRSEVLSVDTGQAEAVLIHVMLIQSTHPAGEPMLSMTVVDGVRAPVPVSEHMMMSLGLATVLTYRVRQLIDAAKGGRAPRNGGPR